MGGDALRGELDALALRLGRGLTLDGVDGELLAHSSQAGGADPARVAAILGHRAPPQVRAWEEQHLVPDAREPFPVPANAALGMDARLGLPIRRGGRCVAYLWMPGESLTADELAVARATAAVLAERLAAPDGADPPARPADRLVRRLFDQGDPEVFAQLVAGAPGLLDGRAEVVAVVPAGADSPRQLGPGEAGALAGLLTPALRGRGWYVGAHVTPAHALLLTCAADLAEVREVAARCLGDGFTVGVGEAARFEPDGIATAREQAVTAAELAVLDPGLGRSVRWAELGAYRDLLGAPEPELLAPLDGSAFLVTLETYLDLAGDVQRTAAALHLHRSSLYYRLGRIEQLLGVDLADGRTRLRLHMAVKRRLVARVTLR